MWYASKEYKRTLPPSPHLHFLILLSIQYKSLSAEDFKLLTPPFVSTDTNAYHLAYSMHLTSSIVV